MKKLIFVLLLSPLLNFSQSKKAKFWFDMGMDQYKIMFQSGDQPSWDGELALSCFSKAIDKYPKYTEAYFMRGIIYSATSSCDLAIREFSEVVRLDPNHKKVRIYFGMCLNAKGLYSDAIKYLTKVIELDKENSELYFERANSRSEIKDFDGAISDLNKALKYNNNKNPIFLKGLYYSRANYKYKSENYGAIDYCSDYKKAKELDPQLTSAGLCEEEIEYYMRKGKSKISSKHYKGAIADYTYAILLKPDFVDAFIFRGFCKTELNSYEGAIDDYTKAIEIDSNNTMAYLNRGYVKNKLKNYEGAIDDYTKAIEIDSSYAIAYFNRANLNKKLGKSYCIDYKKACELDGQIGCNNYNKECN